VVVSGSLGGGAERGVGGISVVPPKVMHYGVRELSCGPRLRYAVFLRGARSHERSCILFEEAGNV
jgi:hypothetical protein